MLLKALTYSWSNFEQFSKLASYEKLLLTFQSPFSTKRLQGSRPVICPLPIDKAFIAGHVVITGDLQ